MKQKEAKFNDLPIRISLSIIAMLVTTLLIFFIHNPWNKGLFILAILAVEGVAVWEFARLAKSKGFFLRETEIIVLSELVVFSFFLSSQWSKLASLPYFVFFLASLVFFLLHFTEIKGAIAEVAIEIFTLIYLAIPVGLFVQILLGEHGRWWIFYLLLVAKSTDIGGYFFGKLFGKKKLALSISAKKTVAGAVGGLGSAILVSVVYALVFSHLFFLNLFYAVVFGTILGIFSQIGDLLESLCKRDAQVKDSNVIPGLGGILDMIDGLIVTIPLLYFFIGWL